MLQIKLGIVKISSRTCGSWIFLGTLIYTSTNASLNVSIATQLTLDWHVDQLSTDVWINVSTDTRYYRLIHRSRLPIRHMIQTSFPNTIQQPVWNQHIYFPFICSMLLIFWHSLNLHILLTKYASIVICYCAYLPP